MSETYCTARHARFDGWSGLYPRCSLAPGHAGPHMTTYGLKFDDKGRTI